ncbi:hypothetical protein CAAN1_08S03510 [[Candida] anglica]|uniref:Mediator of RNA polymerase II transcription subunit 9 n=1 Tax=[Candida] anglica TaxID=148631 RepID=A0ABP0E8E4_9ASCO
MSSSAVLEKLQRTELLPDLFALLHDLKSGVISARDFDNHAGSIRLKVTQMKQQLQQIEGINRSLEDREAEIRRLEENNRRKREFLQTCRQSNESSDKFEAIAEE